MRNSSTATAILLILVCITIPSCRKGASSTKTAQPKQIESALRDLLAAQRAAIEKDAPFVYEIDTFAGGVKAYGKDDFVMGSWTVNITGSRVRATARRHHYGKGQRFESEVVEVDLEVNDDSIKVVDWRAYWGWGTQTRGNAGSAGDAEEKALGEGAT